MVRSNLVSISVSPPTVFQINITNTQNIATPVPFQQMIQLPISQLGLINPYVRNIGPLRFSYNGSYIPAWLESISNGVATIWVKLPVSIPANSSITIDMEVDPSLNFDGNYWGESPLLSSTYAQYDNGANVFPYYQRWGSLSGLPSGWSSISGANTNITNFPSYTEISSQVPNEWNGIYTNSPPSSLVSTQTVWEFYGSLFTGTFIYVGTNTNTVFGTYEGYSFNEQPSPRNIYFGTDGNPYYVQTSYVDTNAIKIYTMQMNSATNVQLFVNYSQIYSSTNIPAQNPNSFQIGISGSTNNIPFYIYWLRTRAPPPNGVMPSVEVIA